MRDKFKIALIAAVASVGITWMVMHYSPYQTCVRAKAARIVSDVMEVEQSRAESHAASIEGLEPGTLIRMGITPPTPANPEETAAEAKRTAEIMCAGGQT